MMSLIPKKMVEESGSSFHSRKTEKLLIQSISIQKLVKSNDWLVIFISNVYEMK